MFVSFRCMLLLLLPLPHLLSLTSDGPGPAVPALDYKDPDFATKLLDACPWGVDVYFDNVGGDVSNAVLRKMNVGGRVPICGQIAAYNDDVAYDALCSDAGVPADIAELLQTRGVRRARFTVINYPHVRVRCRRKKKKLAGAEPCGLV